MDINSPKFYCEKVQVTYSYLCVRNYVLAFSLPLLDDQIAIKIDKFKIN